MSSFHQIPDKERLLNLLKSFISFTSVHESPDQKQECIDWIQTAFLGNYSGDVQRGSHEGSPWLHVPHANCKLLVFAHVDVVPATDDMFTLRIDGDKALGRGVSDMKGNILPFLMAYADTLDTGKNPPVSILITTDEEVAGTTIPHLIEQKIVDAPVAFTPDTDSRGIVTEHKGVVWAELVAHGSGGHGAYPWKTENPVWLLADALKNIQKAFPSGTQADWQMTVSPTILQGSGARNQVDNTALCGLDIRYPPESFASPEKAIEAVSAVLPDGCELRVVQTASPLYTDGNHEMVQRIRRIAEETLQQEAPLSREHGGTDARYFSEAGIPAFLYGPEGGGLHSKEEWVSIASLQKHYVLYRNLFDAL